jgi:hypothetical protein
VFFIWEEQKAGKAEVQPAKKVKKLLGQYEDGVTSLTPET